MKIWKVIKSSVGTVAYVKVPDDCTIYDTSYAAVKLVREKFNDHSICGTQVFNKVTESFDPGLPVYTL